MAQVTDEMVEKAQSAANKLRRHSELSGWDWCSKPMMRAALESVADDLRREGEIEGIRIAARQILNDHSSKKSHEFAKPLIELADRRSKRLARAMLSPAKQKETA